jgi:hypothetical protein
MSFLRKRPVTRSLRNRLGQQYLGSLHDHLHFPQVIFDRLEGNVVFNV